VARCQPGRASPGRSCRVRGAGRKLRTRDTWPGARPHGWSPDWAGWVAGASFGAGGQLMPPRRCQGLCPWDAAGAVWGNALRRPAHSPVGAEAATAPANRSLPFTRSSNFSCFKGHPICRGPSLSRKNSQAILHCFTSRIPVISVAMHLLLLLQAVHRRIRMRPEPRFEKRSGNDRARVHNQVLRIRRARDTIWKGHRPTSSRPARWSPSMGPSGSGKSTLDEPPGAAWTSRAAASTGSTGTDVTKLSKKQLPRSGAADRVRCSSPQPDPATDAMHNVELPTRLQRRTARGPRPSGPGAGRLGTRLRHVPRSCPVPEAAGRDRRALINDPSVILADERPGRWNQVDR